MSNPEEQILKRMNRIGSKKNFAHESETAEAKENDQIVIVSKRQEGMTTIIDLTLEPENYDRLSSEVRLNFQEFCSAMNNLIDEEESEWDSLRMKDQVDLTKDFIIQETMLKHAKENLKLDIQELNGKQISYLRRFNEKGEFIGYAITLSLLVISTIGFTV